MRSDVAKRELAGTGAGKIEHVVYIVQENRSFDNMFQGYPGADTVSHGKELNGIRGSSSAGELTFYEVDHSANAMFAACNGRVMAPGTDCRMDGFDKELHSTVSGARSILVCLRTARGDEAVIRHGARVGNRR